MHSSSRTVATLPQEGASEPQQQGAGCDLDLSLSCSAAWGCSPREMGGRHPEEGDIQLWSGQRAPASLDQSSLRSAGWAFQGLTRAEKPLSKESSLSLLILLLISQRAVHC